MASAAARKCPMTQIPGWHLSTLIYEPLHVGPLGVCQDVCGYTLVDLCEEGAFGASAGHGTWQEKLQPQLDSAYDEFILHCKRSRPQLYCYQKRFTVASLDMKTLNTSWPRLKTKGGNCLVVLQWLAL